MRMGIKENFLSLAQMVATQLRCIAVGEFAGERAGFGGIGPQLTNLSTDAPVAFADNQEAAAK